MDAFLQLSAEERREACRIAEERISLRAASIEKDFWICWTLRELFALPGIGGHLTFKGGTSLSKGWKLIERFSEDLDVTVARAHLGFGGERSPEFAPSANQRTKRLDALQEACHIYIRDTLTPALAQRISERVADGRLIGEPDDPLSVLFEYPSVFPADAYLRPFVKIELGARSDIDPSETPEIRPYLAEAVPEALGHSAFKVRALSPKRTFWEKAMLLHEETYRVDGPGARLARHYYDLWCLIRAGVAAAATADHDLFDRVAAHRVIFFRKGGGAQESLRRGSLRLLPSAEHRGVWEKDYQTMQEAMFFGETPEFEQILRAVGEFERRFNASAQPAS
jgi:hypothetical protein